MICRIFGSHCQEALQVSECESGFHTDAQNGQYLGLFQMGTSERRIFGHGPSAEEQAKAAHRYFVDPGETGALGRANRGTAGGELCEPLWTCSGQPGIVRKVREQLPAGVSLGTPRGRCPACQAEA